LHEIRLFARQIVQDGAQLLHRPSLAVKKSLSIAGVAHVKGDPDPLFAV
jgi:hypothetical protein